MDADQDRAMWLAIRRALILLIAAIEKRWGVKD